MAPGTLARDISDIEEMYERMSRVLEKPESVLAKRTPVSGWTVSEQVEHVLLANRWALGSILSMLAGQGDFPTTGRLNLLGVALLRAGRIPRGRGEAPATAAPRDGTTAVDLRRYVAKHQDYLRTIKKSQGEVHALRTRFRHPFFGYLRATDGVRFVRVHTNHHLSIVTDILEAAER